MRTQLDPSPPPETWPTLPPGSANAALVLAAPPVGRPAVRWAVGGVTGRPRPVALTLAVRGGADTAAGVPQAALAATRAVVGTGVHPGGRGTHTSESVHVQI